MSKLTQDLKAFVNVLRGTGNGASANMIDQAFDRIKGLELDLRLSNTAIRQKIELLASCEQALIDRTTELEEAKCFISELQEQHAN